MILVLGLLILVVAVVVAMAGVFSNLGSGHAFHGFAVLGHHMTGSTGTLFLFGIVVGAVGVFGLSLLLTAARRTSRRGGAARNDLRQSRQDTATVSQDRDSLIEERESARAYAAADPRVNGSPEQIVAEPASSTVADPSTGADPAPVRIVTP